MRKAADDVVVGSAYVEKATTRNADDDTSRLLTWGRKRDPNPITKTIVGVGKEGRATLRRRRRRRWANGQ